MCVKVIGFGTGRCGTKSLSAFLSNQPNTRVTHESRFLAHLWYDDRDISFNHFWDVLHRVPMDFYGDVSFNHLPYVERLAVRSAAIKLIYLEREPDATVNSFYEWTGKNEFPVNHWLNEMHTPGQYIQSNFDKLFPKYDKYTRDKKTAIALYVKDYHNQARRLIEKYPDRIFKLKLAQLNDDHKLNELLDWLGYDSNNRNIDKFKLNTNETA